MRWNQRDATRRDRDAAYEHVHGPKDHAAFFLTLALIILIVGLVAS